MNNPLDYKQKNKDMWAQVDFQNYMNCGEWDSVALSALIGRLLKSNHKKPTFENIKKVWVNAFSVNVHGGESALSRVILRSIRKMKL